MTATAKVTYLDTAMVLIEIAGLRILTDPVFDAEGTVFEDGPVRLVKKFSAVASAEKLGHIDAVLLSHDQHSDNLDAGGRALLGKVPRVLSTPIAAERLGGSAEGLAPWQTATLASRSGENVLVTAVPAQHAPDHLVEATGPVTGFVVEVGKGNAPIYISGDTIRFGGTAEIARRFAPVGIAILHLGRAQIAPLGEAALSLDANEAGKFAKELQAKAIVPIHFEGWGHFTQGRDEAEPVFAANGLADRVHWLARGASANLALDSR